MNISTIKRTKDIFSEKEDLELLYIMERFPVYCGVTEQKEEADAFADMRWMISKNSGMIQLGELLPEEVLYSVSHNSNWGGVWREHHEKFAEFLQKFKRPGGVLEIGGGNGALNAYYVRKYGNVDWTIIDPTTVEYAEGCKAKFIKKLWNDEADTKGCDFSTLIHSHLMEHQYDLQSFMKLNEKVLRKGDRMIFTFPDLKQWIKKKYSNALFWEHTYLVTEEYIDAILSKYGFSVIEKEYFGDGHSIFYAAEKTEEKEVIQIDGDILYRENTKDFFEWIDFMKEKAIYYNNRMKSFEGNVYLFGAHIFSQMLIQFGLNIKKIKMILDNDPRKQEKRLYGTPFMVSSPKILKEENAMVLLNAGAYQNEIKSDILANLNSATLIIE